MFLRRFLLPIGALTCATLGYAGLTNTGAGQAGGDHDLNYSVAYGADISSALSATATPYSTVISPGNASWIASGGDSEWIGVQNSPYTSDPVGYYVYSYKIEAGLFSGGSATIGGRWATDNEAQLYVNGAATGNLVDYSSPSGYSFQHWTDFSLSNVKEGDTLQFIVHNANDTTGANPTGLRVEYKNATVESTPEPFTMALMIGGIGIAIRRRMSK